MGQDHCRSGNRHELIDDQDREAAPGTPEAFGAYMKSEYSKWGKIIAEAGIATN